MCFWSKLTKLWSKGFSSCWDFHDSSLRLPWMEIEWQFKIAVSTSRRGMLSAFANVYGCWIGLETRNGVRMQPAVVEKIENQGRCTWKRRGASDSKSPSPMRAAECFLPLPVIKDVESAWKHETGLKCDQRLPRKLRITVLTQQREERRPASKVAVSDSRRWRYPAFVGPCRCWVGPKTRNWARMRSAVVEKIENQGRYSCRRIA
jgi:hypothetical protein